MIKFKQKKSDIIIPKATELRNSIAYEANQEFLKRGDVVVDYLNAKLKDAVAYGYRCEYRQESTDNKIILFFQ